MKQTLKSLLIAVFVLTTQTVFSQIAPSYEVATWPGFRNCAVSYTFDDGCAEQFSKAIPIFNEFDFKLTLFTVSGWTSNWNNLQNAANQGHEVANHSTTHANFGTLSVDKQETELKTCNDLINTKISGQQSITMSYPYCAKGNDALHKKYFIAARGCQGFIEPKTPGDFMNVSSLSCGKEGPVISVKDFKTKADQASASKGWLVYLIHGIDNDGGYSPLPSDTLKASLHYLKENENKFWVSTFVNAARYIKERNCASVTETTVTESSIGLSVSDTLNNEQFDFPLTIRRTLPTGWSQATVSQNGKAVTSSIVEVNSIKYIQFAVVPDGGSVLITKVIPANLKEIKGSIENNKFNVWINNNSLHFTVPANCKSNPTVSLYNFNGSQINTFKNVAIVDKVGSIQLFEKLNAGLYLIQLTDNLSVWTNKIRITNA